MSLIADILVRHARTQPERFAYAFLHEADVRDALTYEALDRRARIIAAQLLGSGATGTVLLLYPSGLEFIAAFFGCLYAGVTAVPLYLPRRNPANPRLAAIVADSQARFGLTTSAALAEIERRPAEHSEIAQVRWIATDALPIAVSVASMIDAPVESQSPAYLQYTSGSTSTPKGVIVSDSGLLHTLLDLDRGWQHDRDSVMVTWLPLFHDMGLIYGILQPLYSGFPCYLMDPAAFLQRPFRWLDAISRHGGTHSAAPNFAFDLCVRSINAAQKSGLNLRRWRVALNAAEPVRADTLRRFAAAFAPCGFALRAFCPGYGLAESTLKVTAVRRDVDPTLLRVRADALALGRVEGAGADDPNTRTLVGCGVSEVNARIAIVDPGTATECAPARVGEVWVRSDSVAHGYWRQPQESARTFGARLAATGEGPFLRTGDLGFVRDGELFITGRLKDIIIIRGGNHYPQDIELSVERCHPALRPGAGAAFALEVDDEEQLVIVHEVERTRLRHLDTDAVVQAIRAAVARDHELTVHAVALLRPASIPKTSSGKIQHGACRQEFQSGRLNVIAQWHQPSMLRAAEAAALSPPSGALAVGSIRQWILDRLAAHLKVAPAQLDVSAPFATLGLDSLSAVRLSGELEEWLDRPLSPTVVFEHPTPDALARYLASPETPRAPATSRSGGTAAEPIAVIGIGCRFPGASDADAFWQALRAGADTVGPSPVSRWGAAVGAATATSTSGVCTIPGHFLDAVDRFDADFFGISPREAQSMDPQQRLLLETAWEAIENAGLAELAGSPTGVFIGISTSDYARLLLGRPNHADAYAGTGGALSIAANRLSYLLDLRGPSWAVDTACSSSLVAVYNACQALRLRECDLALAGGVNVIASPQLTVALGEARMLAGDGRCKAFDAAADGYGRGEGCGVVVLKRYADALRDGDPITAVVLGSAVNQDGRSNGLTAPNGLAQQEVVRRALENASVEPAAIGYVETHGTGTPLGDPIEVNALTAALSDGRTADQHCWLGSVKTSIGHLEAAAGIAGFIKTVLALRYGELPPHLHLKQLNPHIRLDGTPFSIPTVRQPWPSGGRRRIAGVSSFGFGGTNAHVIVAEPEPAGVPARVAAARHGPEILTLSAKHPNALKELAGTYADWLDAHPDAPLGDVCFTAATGRTHFRYRCAVVASSPQQMRQQLAAVAAGQSPAGVSMGETQPSAAPAMVFLFSGQGSQYPAMGRELYETQPRFRQTLQQCEALLRPHLDVPLLELLYGLPQCGALLEQTVYAQPALFALEYALFELWQSWGIRPSAVIGHSLGEYVAACAAGVFSLEDGLRLVAERGRLMQAAPGTGEMFAVCADAALTLDVMAPLAQEIAIAALNGPCSTVISGSSAAMAAAAPLFAGRQIATKKLRTSHAFHSTLMDPVIWDFRRAAASVIFRAPRIELISNLSGRSAGAELTSAEYWCRQLREPVRFAAGIETLARCGHRLYLELGPQPVLSVLGPSCVSDAEGFAWLPSLGRGADSEQMLASLAELYARGAEVNWREFYRDRGHRRLPLPSYRFQQQRFWVAVPATALNAARAGNAQSTTQVAQLIERCDAEALARLVAPAANLDQEHLHIAMACMRTLVDQHHREASARALSSWFYEVSWQLQARHERPATRGPGRWLLLADRGGLGEGLKRRLEEAGAECVMLSAAELSEDTGEHAGLAVRRAWTVLDRWLDAAALRPPSDLHTIVDLSALDAPPAEQFSAEALVESHAAACAGVLRLMRDVCRRPWPAFPKLWWVTQGAATATGEPPGAADAHLRRRVDHASIWGLGRVIRLEHPELWGGLVDLSPDRHAREQADALATELLDPQGEDQISFQAGMRCVPRLEPMAAAHLVDLGSRERPCITADATYLVTGGLGALGLKVAEWLVGQGARQLMVVGRSPASAAARQRLALLEESSARIVVKQADVSREDDLSRVLAEVRAALPPLRGVIHAAGVIDDGILLRLDRARLAAVLAPKVAGAWNLHRLTRDLPLDFFVLFSSASALLGWRGQGSYAAANALLDALAHDRRAQGLPALSINWGPWADIGKAAQVSDRHSVRWAEEGVESLDPDVGLRALELALRQASPQVAVMRIDWERFGRTISGVPRSSMLPVAATPAPSRVAALSDGLGQRLREATASERRRLVMAHVQAEVAALLGVAPGALPEVRRGLFDMGFDSLMALELRDRLNATLETRLSPTLAFEHPSIMALTEHLLGLLAGTDAAPAPRTTAARAETLAEIRNLSDAELESLVDVELQRSLR